MINNDSDYLSFIFFLIFLFVHPILNVVAIFNVIFFFLAKLLSILGPLHQLYPLAGICLFLIFKYLVSFCHLRSQLQSNGAPVERPSLTLSQKHPPISFPWHSSLIFYIALIVSVFFFLIYLFLDICMCVWTYTCICFFLCLSQLE